MAHKIESNKEQTTNQLIPQNVKSIATMCGKAQHVFIHDVLVIGKYLFIDVLVICSPARLPTSQRGTQHPAAARPAAGGESPVDEAPMPPQVDESPVDEAPMPPPVDESPVDEVPTPPLVQEALADFGEDDGVESEEAKIMAEGLFGTVEPLSPQSTKAS